ncbi:MAG: urease accessory protein UreD [Caulobacteraceae bacterium]
MVKAEGASTHLDRLYQEGCGKIRLPREADDTGATAVLINSSGGVTSGDHLAWSGEAGPGARLTLTTQACEKLYRAMPGENPARIDTRLTVGPGARIDWLPQESIVFDGASAERRLDANLAEGAEILAVEAVLLGRAAMGERVRHAHFTDRWRIRRNGHLIFADDVRFSGDIAGLTDAAATLAGGTAYASVLLVSPRAGGLLPAARLALDEAGGASAWGGKLFCRLTAASGLELRRRLIPILTLLRGGAPLPRAWSL